MTARLLISPAGAGKSMWVAREAVDASQDVAASPVICVARPLQVFAMVERLGAIGGALGVRVMTFDSLAAECLTASRVVLPDPGREVTFRILQSTIRALGPTLEHFGVLADRPGLAEEVRRLIVELESARIDPPEFAAALDAVGRPARLKDVAAIYADYKATLDRLGWTDRPGIMTRAIRAFGPVDEVGAPSQSEMRHDRHDQVSTAHDYRANACRWSHLYIDGFDDLSVGQIELLALLAERVDRLEITLTGEPDIASDSRKQRSVHRRFARTRLRVEAALGIKAEPLPESSQTTANEESGRRTSAQLSHLERELYPEGAHARPEVDPAGIIELIETPNRSGEVREALRWIKARILRDGVRPEDVALLARDLEPYRAAVMGIAAEMRIPIRLATGLPLASNPAVAALIELLRLARRDAEGEALMPRRQVVDAWRSPYFDWLSALVEFEGQADLGAEPHTDGAAVIADAIDAVARWGSVIGGERQWREALQRLEAIGQTQEGELGQELDEESDVAPPPGVPTGAAAAKLHAVFSAFIQRLKPPQNATMREHVRWLEGLIGSDPLQSGRVSGSDGNAPDGSLQLVARCRRTWGDTALNVDSKGDSAAAIDVSRRDISALEALKDVMRALVAADEALAGETGPTPITFEEFANDLSAAIEAAVHGHDSSAEDGAVLLADVVSARGLPFRSLALMGMAEGEFPTNISENPLLRDAERALLRKVHGLSIQDSTESAELEYFYESITRPSEHLLLTRPRLADNGAMWKPSPFWEEVIDITGVEPRSLGSSHLPAPEDAAGIAERFVAAAMLGTDIVLEVLSEVGSDLAAMLGTDRVREDPSKVGSDPEAPPHAISDTVPSGRARWTDVEAGAEVLLGRSSYRDERGGIELGGIEPGGAGPGRQSPTPYDGDLSSISAHLGRRYGPTASWSPSSLETMIGCGFRFLVERGLGIRQREEPAEGLSAAQLGTIYHELLEAAYEHVPLEERTNADTLVAAIDLIADPILDSAPRRHAFRPTAWWRRTRDGIKVKTRLTLRALCEPEIVNGFTPVASELRFGIGDAPPLILEDGEDRLRVRGVIDRVERSADGRIRIVDYKTAGPTAFTGPKLVSGDKIQIALYALAARDALGQGEPSEGFYWHIQNAEASGLKLSKAEGGVEGAMRMAAGHAWSAARHARAGSFAPKPPKDGCPTYCAAAAFCWRYSPKSW